MIAAASAVTTFSVSMLASCGPLKGTPMDRVGYNTASRPQNTSWVYTGTPRNTKMYARETPRNTGLRDCLIMAMRRATAVPRSIAAKVSTMV